MPILSCQKRHHEPHLIPDPRSQVSWYCDGLPKWPYARPKPPPTDFSYDYQRENNTISVYRSYGMDYQKPNWVVDPGGDDYSTFPTHAEAIEYAQNLINQRRNSESAASA